MQPLYWLFSATAVIISFINQLISLILINNKIRIVISETVMIDSCFNSSLHFQLNSGICVRCELISLRHLVWMSGAQRPLIRCHSLSPDTLSIFSLQCSFVKDLSQRALEFQSVECHKRLPLQYLQTHCHLYILLANLSNFTHRTVLFFGLIHVFT